jgi:hypothetical protein
MLFCGAFPPRRLSASPRMSPSTIDRALASSRSGLPTPGISTIRAGTLLKHEVAIKTFAEWTECTNPP